MGAFLALQGVDRCGPAGVTLICRFKRNILFALNYEIA
jgi:hypothetical protein